MATYLKTWGKEDVIDAESFSEYVQQMLGVPWPTYTDLKILRAKAQEIFNRYPQISWASLCRVADWMRTRHKRPARVWMVLEAFRDAFAAGVLPELDPRDEEDPELERFIAAALEVETDQYWKERLIGSRGVSARRRTFDAWLNTSPISA